LGIWDEIFRYITSGQPFGIPTLVVMAVPFIVGFVAAFLIKKVLKITIVLVILAFVASYVGLFNMSLHGLKDAANTYGPQVLHYATLLTSILPLGIGFFLGLILGFIVG